MANLKRYSYGGCEYGRMDDAMYEDDEGEYVKFADLMEGDLQTTGRTHQPGHLQQLKEAIAFMLRYATRLFDNDDMIKFVEYLKRIEQRASI